MTEPNPAERRPRRAVKTVDAGRPTDGSDASDESSDEALDRDAKVPAIWRRPSGQDATDYAGWETWKPQRWAWEFLRRNGKFQEACDDEWDEPLVIAEEFRLREFKDYRQEYADGKRPRFAAGIQSLPNRAEFARHAEAEVTLIEVQTNLLPTEVLIRFQIAPLLAAEETSLKLQLEQARKRLKEFAKMLRGIQREGGTGRDRRVHTFDPGRLLAAMRILDWQTRDPDFNGRAVADELLGDPFEDGHRQLTLAQRSKQAGELLESAQGYASQCGHLRIRMGKLKPLD